MNCFDCLKNEKVLYFVGGIAAATIGVKALKSQTARKACVTGLAKGMKIHKEAQAVFQTMKEDAQDLCYDAKVAAGCTEAETAAEKTEE